MYSKQIYVKIGKTAFKQVVAMADGLTLERLGGSNRLPIGFLT